MGAHGIGFSVPRSMGRDRKILEHRLKKGTLPRILKFAKHYRPALIIFLSVVVLDAVISSISPLLLRAIIDIGIPKHRVDLVIGLAALTAALAIGDAGLQLVERRISAIIGEGLIYDLRVEVFRHIQEMPIAFFSRTQTGALISRLNNDVIGAQQAFTDLFSNVVGNVVVVAIILVVMFFLSWQITLVALILVPIFLIPARKVGRRLGTLFQRGMELNAEMNMVMSERFNVAGAMLVKLFGRPSEERATFEHRAAQVRDIGVRQATYQRYFFISLSLTASLATAFAYGFGGVEAARGVVMVGTVVALTAYLGSPLRPADAALEPQHRLHVGDGQLRAALRGARPRAHDQREPERACRFRPVRPSCALPTSTFRTPALRTSRSRRSRRSLDSTTRRAPRCCTTSASMWNRAR